MRDQLHNISKQIVLTQLNAGVAFESKPENYGIDNFVKAKEIIALFIWFYIFNETISSICEVVDYICWQILASSSPNKITRYLFRHWEVKVKIVSVKNFV